MRTWRVSINPIAQQSKQVIASIFFMNSSGFAKMAHPLGGSKGATGRAALSHESNGSPSSFRVIHVHPQLFHKARLPNFPPYLRIRGFALLSMSLTEDSRAQ